MARIKIEEMKIPDDKCTINLVYHFLKDLDLIFHADHSHDFI